MTYFAALLTVLAVWAGAATADPRSVRSNIEPLDAPATPVATAVGDPAKAPYVFAEYYSIDPACKSFAIGDFDGDGHDDIALAEPGSTGIGLLTNDGTDRFERRGLLPLPTAPIVVVAADFNQDGVDDLAAGLEGGGLAVFMSSGAGSPRARDHRHRRKTLLGKPEVFAIPARLLATGDLNGDGRPDLVAVEDGAVWVRFTRGHHLEAPRRYDYEGVADQVVVGDMNGDGVEDVVLHENVNQSAEWFVTVLHGSRRGLEAGYRADLPRDNYAYPWFSSLVAVDVDSDGDADLAVTGTDGSENLILWNVTGRSASASARFEFGRIATPVEYGVTMVVGDANTDGHPDLVCLTASKAGPLDAAVHVFTWRGAREIRELWSLSHGMDLYYFSSGIWQIGMSSTAKHERPFFGSSGFGVGESSGRDNVAAC